MKIKIKNGLLIDPATKREEVCDLMIEDTYISAIGELTDEMADEEIDAKGLCVMPGFIDLHVHLREPGYTHKETIRTGSLAAAKGGFTSICPMPNTKPAIDNIEMLEFIKNKAQEESVVNIYPIGAITVGQEGNELVDIESMANKGAVAISEDGKSVMDVSIYIEAMKIASKVNIPIFAHCEDRDLVRGGVMNAGKVAEGLKLPGIINAVEDVITARDILLAKETNAKLHLCHCSTRDSARMVKVAKEEGLLVSAEACPHHFTLCDEDIMVDDANYKMNPPLRSREDLIAIKEALRDNVIDVIATDHAPHSEDEKKKSMKEAPFGIVGLETAYALTNTELVKKGYLTNMQLAEKMSYNPAKILGIDKGTLQVGAIADIVITDPNEKYRINRNDFVSMGKNMPFEGKEVTGKIKYTIVSGKIVYNNI